MSGEGNKNNDPAIHRNPFLGVCICAVMVFIEESSGPLKRARCTLDHGWRPVFGSSARDQDGGTPFLLPRMLEDSGFLILVRQGWAQKPYSVVPAQASFL